MTVYPGWFAPFAALVEHPASSFSRFTPPPGGDHRQAAVLILLGEGPDGPDVVLTQRSDQMRSHPGQVSFPGGALEPGEDAPGAALREAAEEIGLAAQGVHVQGVLPELYVPVSRFAVTPVIAWWREPGPVWPVDAGEVARVDRVALSRLADPAVRFSIRHASGFTGPGFSVDGLFIWGFTAGLLAQLLKLTGREVPWNTADIRPLPPGVAVDRRQNVRADARQDGSLVRPGSVDGTSA